MTLPDVLLLPNRMGAWLYQHKAKELDHWSKVKIKIPAAVCLFSILSCRPRETAKKLLIVWHQFLCLLGNCPATYRVCPVLDEIWTSH